MSDVTKETTRAIGVETYLASMITNLQTTADRNSLITAQGILSAQSTVIDQNTMDIAALKARCNFDSTIISANTAIIAQLQTAQNTLITTVGDIVNNSDPLFLVSESGRATAAEAVLTTSVVSLNGRATADELRITTCETSIAAASAVSLTSQAVTSLITAAVLVEQGRAATSEGILTNSVTSLNTSRMADELRLTTCETNIAAASAGTSPSNDITLVAGQGGQLSIGTSSTTGNIVIGNESYTTRVQGNLSCSSVISDSTNHEMLCTSWWFNAFGGNSTDSNGSPQLVVGNLYGNMRVIRAGKTVTIQLYPCSGTPSDANQTAIYATRLPSWACPPQDIVCLVIVMANNMATSGMLMIGSNGTIRMNPLDGNWWNNSGLYSITSTNYLVG